jgi:hypothetical protein
MVKAHKEWTVLEHGPIEKLTENLWRVEGACPGMSIRRAMTIAKMKDGRLVLHDAIALAEAAMKEVEAWGTPAFLVVGNGWHRLDAPAYKLRYPDLTIFAPKGSRAKVEEVIPVAGTYEDFPGDDVVRLETLRGIKGMEGVMTVRSPDGVTVILDDVVFNMKSKPSDAMGWLITSLFGSAPGPRVSRLFKMLAIDDKKELKNDLDRLAATPDLRRVIVSHGAVATGADASTALRAAAGRL